MVLGLISFKIADSIDYKYRMVHENFVNQINGKDLSDKDIKNIERSLRTINETFHTFESVAIFTKKDGFNFSQYFESDFKDAEYLFPINIVKKDNFITEGFQVGAGFEAGKYFVVHRSFPQWYFLIPATLFTVSGILFMLWLLFQIKYVCTTRWAELKLN
jgi:hypothetical protein